MKHGLFWKAYGYTEINTCYKPKEKNWTKKGAVKLQSLQQEENRMFGLLMNLNKNRCVFKDNKAKVIDFENWITEEVPSIIRRTGMYNTDNLKQRIIFIMYTGKTYTVTKIA